MIVCEKQCAELTKRIENQRTFKSCCAFSNQTVHAALAIAGCFKMYCNIKVISFSLRIKIFSAWRQNLLTSNGQCWFSRTEFVMKIVWNVSSLSWCLTIWIETWFLNRNLNQTHTTCGVCSHKRAFHLLITVDETR